MVRELRVKWAEDPLPSWERRVGLWYELAYEGVPLPDDFRHLLEEDYQHLVEAAPARAEENKLAWANYHSWLEANHFEDLTPRERLAKYFQEQEAKVG